MSSSGTESQSSAGPKRADYICDASQLCSHTPADNGQQLQPLFPPPAVSVHRNTRVCAGNAPRASAKRLENKRVIVHLPSCHTAAGPGVAKCWTHARRKSKNKKQKTSETAIKSLEELSRVMRCRQSIPSFYPHVKSAPPSSHNMCKQHFVYYERKHRNVLVQLHLERKKWRDVHFSCFLSQIYI